MMEGNLLLVLVALPFLAALVASTISARTHNAAAWSSGLLLAAGLGILWVLRGPLQNGEVVRTTVRWVPSVGLDLSFRMDAFVWLFVTLVFAIAILVLV